MGRTAVSQCLTVYKKLQPNEDAEVDVWVKKKKKEAQCWRAWGKMDLTES